jgi:hypothetical protein
MDLMQALAALAVVIVHVGIPKDSTVKVLQPLALSFYVTTKILQIELKVVPQPLHLHKNISYNRHFCHFQFS